MVRAKRTIKKVDYSQYVDTADDREDEDADVVMNDAEDDGDDDEEFKEALVELNAADDMDLELELDMTNGKEDILEPKPTAKKRGRKTKPKPEPKPKPKPNKAATKKDLKNQRNLSSIKDKFLRMFGYNTHKLIDVIKHRADWDEVMFQFDQKLLEKSNTITVPVVDLPVVEYNTLSKVDLSRKFPSQKKDPVTFQFDVDEPEIIKPGSQLTNESLHVFNTNTLITDLAWLPQSEQSDQPNIQYLAAAVSNITDTATSPKFSIMARNSYTSAFYIYKLDSTSGELTHFKSIVHDWGNSWDLKWIQSSAPSSGLGALCAVFNDGNARILNLPLNGPDIIEIKTPSLQYHLPGHMISTLDITSDHVICGTDTGYVAEFALDSTEPSYLSPLHSSYILSIRLSTSPHDDTVAYTTCADGSSALFTVDDIVTSVNRTSKSKNISKICVYSPQTHSFILLGSTNTIDAIPIRCFFVGSTLVSHDGSVESVAGSGIHPLLLSGGADGKVKVNSVSRRLLNGQKISMATHRVLTLWELQFGEKERRYRLLRNHQVESANAYENAGFLNVYPPNVSFGSMSWNENVNAGNWFAAATTSGLLFVDKL